MADSRPLGIFDSGLGGLTVAREIKKLMPNESIVYFGDTGRVPYGTKSEGTIIRYARQDEKFLLDKGAKAIIAACGTVSAVAAFTGDELPVPFFEVVTSAAECAVKATKCGKIGVLGTPATIRSAAHKEKIEKLNPDLQVAVSPCPMFVPFVENGWTSEFDPVVKETARRYLLPLIQEGVDTVILGCTHYPVLSKVISAVMGDQVTLINPGYAVAQSVKDYLTQHNMCSDAKESYKNYYVSDCTSDFERQASLLLGEDKITAEQVELNA